MTLMHSRSLAVMDRETLDFLGELEREQQKLPSNDSIVAGGDRQCPICKKEMRVEVECGVHVDVCDDHGLWLDRGELPAIVSRIRSGERVNRVQALRRARRDGKMSGTIFGVWSLLFD